jgi:hypothetical protein
MKIIKMHNMDMEKFDGFLHTQLQHIDVDASMMDTNMEKMNFPVAIEIAAPKSFLQKFGWKLFLLGSVVLVLLISTILLNNNTKKEKDTTNQKNEIPTIHNQTVVEYPTQHIETNSTSTTLTTSENDAVTTKDNSSKNLNTSATINELTKAEKKSATPTTTNTDNYTTKPETNKREEDQNIGKLNTNNVIVKSQLDTATTKPIAKKVEVKRDTVHIIW